MNEHITVITKIIMTRLIMIQIIITEKLTLMAIQLTKRDKVKVMIYRTVMMIDLVQ